MENFSSSVRRSGVGDAPRWHRGLVVLLAAAGWAVEFELSGRTARAPSNGPRDQGSGALESDTLTR